MNNLNSIVDYLKVFNNINKRPAYKPRTMPQEPRNMYAGGQLVQNTVDGSRPGYNGEAKITKLAKEYQKITGSETTLSNIKSKIRKKRLTEDLIDKYKKRGAFGGGFREKIEAVKNPKFYKTVLSELNKVKKQRSKNVFFDYDDVIKTGKWYKDLRTKLGNLNNVDTDTIVKKVLSEEFPGSYYGKTAMRDFRRDKVVKAFINYLDVNGELDGNEKRLPELQKFRGTGNKSYRNINETFQEWTNGDFEVEGIDRKKLKADQIKQIKNWSPQYSSSLSVAKEKSMKFLNDLNTHNPNLSAKEVRQRFFKKFPDVTEGSFNARITHLTQLKNSGVYDIGGGSTKTFKWIVPDKNRSSWLKELLGLKFQGNYSSFINRGDKLLKQGLTKEANRLYAAAEKYFGAKGIFTKVEGQGEHPFSRVFGSGPIGNELKINSLVRNDLNMFKRLNFDEPVIQDLTEYNKSTTTPKRRNELKTLIEGRKKLMNYLTESTNEKGIVESVKFNYGPEKMTVSANVRDIDKVKNFNVEDYVRRGESYLESFKAKGASLFGESGQIIKQKLDKKGLHKFLTQAGFNIDKCLSEGGRVSLKFGKGVNTCITGVIEAEQKAAQRGSKEAVKKFSKFGKAARFGAWFLGPIDIPIELAFALPHMLQGDREAAKRATTAGLLGWGEKKLDEIKSDSPEAYKYAKHVKDNNDWVDAWFSQQDAEQNLEILKNVPEGSQIEKKAIYTNQKNKAVDTMAQIQEGYVGYVDEEGNFDPMGGAKGKTVLQDYLREDVKKKSDAGFQIDIDLPFYQKKNVAGIAPFKGGQPITNVKQYIEQKNEPYWKSGLEHAAYEAGVPDLFDTFMQGADNKDPRDLYSELPLKYASQLGKMEAEETRRLLAEKKAKEEADEAARKYGPYTRFADGGLTRTVAPDSEGIMSLKKKKW